MLCFHWDISRSIPFGPPVLAGVVNVLYNMVLRTKIEQLNKRTVSLANIAVNISCKEKTEMMSPSFRYYYTVIFSLCVTIFWLKIAVRHETLSISFYFLSVFISHLTYVYVYVYYVSWVFWLDISLLSIVKF